MSDVTQLPSAMEAGDPRAGEQLLPMVYDALHKLAAVKMAREKPGQTLQATALVQISEALDDLEKEAPEAAQGVKLRYFAGFTQEQVADSMGISLREAIALIGSEPPRLRPVPGPPAD